jgi:nitroimidazol reductase NimA-like FMN-containing flavoprotein (pyridoxamine 5'-phosphate oxidase superfamily)
MLGVLNTNEIDELLKRNSVGRIACTDGAEVYIVPINYHYESNNILCYSLEGKK